MMELAIALYLFLAVWTPVVLTVRFVKFVLDEEARERPKSWRRRR